MCLWDTFWLTQGSSTRQVDQFIWSLREPPHCSYRGLHSKALRQAEDEGLQVEEICVVSAIEAVLKTNKAIDKFNATAFDDLPTVKRVISRPQHTDGVASYQGARLAD